MTYEMTIAGLKRKLPICPVTDSLYIDPAILYLSMSPINVNTLRTLLSKGENNIASTLAKQEKSMQKFIDKVNKAYGSVG